jgi:nucleotide-binding universal stress UspA family protein
MKRLLVGVNASASAEAALRWATGVADRSGADLVVLAAWSPEQAELPPEEFGDEHAALRARVDAVIANAGGSKAPHVEIVDGDVVDVLLEQADAEDVDLLVVGHGSRRSHASIAIEVAHRITRPLAVIPEGSSFDEGPLALGVDDADGSPTAAAWCADFAASVHAPVTAICVYTHQYEVFPETDERSMYGHITRDLDAQWLQCMRDASVAVSHEVVRDRHVPEALFAAAERAGAQALVVGAHGVAPLVHRRLGGVALHMLHLASLPLILVPQH